MKTFLTYCSILSSFWLFSQSKVTVFDMEMAYHGLELFNPQTITSEGKYHSQPNFLSNSEIVLSAERNGQTDILKYNVATKEKEWLIDTPHSEYSPKRRPTGNQIYAVRLETDGKQRLYAYTPNTNEAEKIVEKLAVAYFNFLNKKTIVASVLVGDKMNLVKIDFDTKVITPLFSDAGRGIERIPGTESLSYTLRNEAGKWDIYVMNSKAEDSYFVAELPVGVQDYTWISDTQILVGMQNKLYLYDTFGEGEWTHTASLSSYNIKNITRMAVSPDGKKLAIASE